MRVGVLIAVLGVAGCDDSPASLGITGPGAPAPLSCHRRQHDQRPRDRPILGPSIGPSIGPVQSSGRYFNYN